MSSKTKNEAVPLSIEQDILNYLRQQENEGQAQEDAFSHLPYSFTESFDHGAFAKCILEDVLRAIQCRREMKKEHERQVRKHNQFELFDLSKIIPDFHIDDEIAEQLCFRETLVIGHLSTEVCNAHPSPVGGLCLNIQMAPGSHPLDGKMPNIQGTPDELDEIPVEEREEIREVERTFSDDLTSSSAHDLEEYRKILHSEMKRVHNKFLVHLSSQMSLKGCNGGSRITTWVDRNMHTLEENRREYLVQEDGSMDEKNLYVALQTKRYYLKITSKKENTMEQMFYKLNKTKHFISEGANFLLMRYLAVARFMGQFELSTMYINGDMCRNIYTCTGPESGIINNTKLDLCKIQRIIIEECGITHRCISVLTLGGRLVKQDWENCDYVLYVNPLVELKNGKPSPREKIPLSKRWEHDMQLFSRYLDMKNVHSLKTKSYLKDHPELKHLISDYVKKILHMKPKQVLDFSLNYFTQCLPDIDIMPRNEYWED